MCKAVLSRRNYLEMYRTINVRFPTKRFNRTLCLAFETKYLCLRAWRLCHTNYVQT